MSVDISKTLQELNPHIEELRRLFTLPDEQLIEWRLGILEEHSPGARRDWQAELDEYYHAMGEFKRKHGPQVRRFTTPEQIAALNLRAAIWTVLWAFSPAKHIDWGAVPRHMNHALTQVHIEKIH